MESHSLNLFIVDDNKSMVTALKHYLTNMFGKSVNISTFYTGASCLEKIDKNTDVVILDYFLNDENGNEVLKLIKKRNPKTEVIMLSSNEDVSTAVEALNIGARDYVVKNNSAWRTVSGLINTIITEPLRKMVREFGVPKFMLIFFATFTIMGIVVYLVLQQF
ncbi:MAG: response regulator [Bacteroidota bacterium]